MAGIRKITHYDATLSQAENARINNVSISGINDYIRRNNIDRRFEKTASLIAECRKYYQSHPKSNKGQVAKGVSEELKQKAGKRAIKEIVESGKGKHKITCSRYFVNMYWQYITTDAVYSDCNEEKAENRKAESPIVENIDANRKELMSEILTEIPEMFEKAEADDVSEFRKFLFEKPNMPMLFIGSGGMNGSYPSLLYGMNSGIGRAITPYMLASLSDETIRNSRCLLLSAGGKNDDIVYATRRCLEVNPENTACFTYYEHDKNRMVDILNGTRAKVFMFRHNELKNGFISIRTKFYKYALMYRAFTGLNDVSEKIVINTSPEKCFTYRTNKEGVNLPNLRKINHFIALFGSYGEPVARDFESVFAEVGLASVQVVDYRNFCHGRFIFAGNHTENYKEPRKESDVAILMIISPREKNIAKQLMDNVIPYKAPVILIESTFDSPLATLDLMAKSNVLISYIAEKCYGINPNSPANYSDIDKRFPINGVHFLSDLKKWGELSFGESDTNLLKDEVEAYISQEHYNTKKIEESQSFLPYPKKSDLYKIEQEEYDASKYLCYAFRRKNDLHKKEYIPLGNMNGGFPFKLNGIEFPCSENAYISGMFSNNTEEHISIQRLLLEETNGYMAKKNIRNEYSAKGREDWYEFNIEWMLFCVWQKVQNNSKFRKILMGIPQGAIIIENSTFQPNRIPDTSAYWGCRNEELKSFHSLVKRYVEACKPDSDAESDRMIQGYMDDYCNDGIYVGNNTMGKILMICKECLHNGTEPDIDYQLLSEKHIYLLGKEIEFTSQVKLNKKVRIVEAPDSAKKKSEKTPKLTNNKPVLSENAIIGACAGDIIGSRYERRSARVYTKEFELFPCRSQYTDDTILTMATMDWILHDAEHTDRNLCDMYYDYAIHNKFGGRFCVYGGSFKEWLKKGDKSLYRVADSNGSAMRVSPVGWAYDSIEEVEMIAEQTARTTHNGAESLRGAKAIAVATFLARKKYDKKDIKRILMERYGYDLNQTCDYWREKNRARNEGINWNPLDRMSLAKNSVPPSIIAFLESASFEDAARLAVSLAGDSDTLCAMTSGISEAYYGIPKEIRIEVNKRLSGKPQFINLINEFSEKFSQ